MTMRVKIKKAKESVRENSFAWERLSCERLFDYFTYQSLASFRSDSTHVLKRGKASLIH